MDIYHLGFSIRLTLAAVLLVAGILKAWGKWVAGRETRVDILDSIGIPHAVSTPIAWSLPIIEVGLGGLLLTRWHVTEALSATSILVMGFTIVLALAMRNGYTGGCSCFGNSGGTVGIVSIGFNAVLLIGAGSAIAIRIYFGNVPALSVGQLTSDDIAVTGILASVIFASRQMLEEIDVVKRLLDSLR